MAEDGTKRPASEGERIDVENLQELHSWSRALGVTPDELKAVVARVGPLARDVRRAVSEGR
jgi:hypothetical protein